jgi:hypothetical protein
MKSSLSVTMAGELLGEPDLLRSNSHFHSAASAVAARPCAATGAAALRRRRAVLTRIAAEPMEVLRLAPDRLAAAVSAEPGTLDRWMVNYLRHRLTCDAGYLHGHLHGVPGPCR